jgi:arsenate reductase
MAHGYLQSLDRHILVQSAGTEPAAQINPIAVKVMREIGIDISHHSPNLIDRYLNGEWDYVITVCDTANESCPVFSGKVVNRLHMGFEDPSRATGTEEFIWSEFRRVRNEIKDAFDKLYAEQIKPKL